MNYEFGVMKMAAGNRRYKTLYQSSERSHTS